MQVTPRGAARTVAEWRQRATDAAHQKQEPLALNRRSRNESMW